ncbi:MAG: hypothetical protein AAF616_02965 [Bacteroidota bacterium]
MKSLTLALAFWALTLVCQAQVNTSPEGVYQWKNQKRTEFQSGFVILRSGKRLEGRISLEGRYSAVEKVHFEGDGKEIEFPVGALESYGLKEKATAVNTNTGGIISDSPPSMYEWNNGGVVMNKVVTNSTPRPGYLVTKNGRKYEGDLKVQRRDDELWSFVIKDGKNKEKFKADEVARYGLSVSADEITQSDLAEMELNFYSGIVFGPEERKGRIGLVKQSFKIEKIVLETADGRRAEYTTGNADAFQIETEGRLDKYIPVDGFFILEEFNGKVFQLYRNPNPTTINRFATDLVKAGVQAGTQAAAGEIVRKDAKDNNYVTNLDSVIQVSSLQDLKQLRDGILELAGYDSVEQMEQFSEDESLNNTVNAIELAIAGKELAASDEGLYNREWIILNKNTGVETVVYRSDYKDLIEPLLFGCYDYLSLDKSSQREYQKWKNLNATVEYLDSCY